MNIQKINNINTNQITNFKSSETKPKREFIDLISDNVRNPRDVNDCVAVPRGIFKAYIYLMIGSALITAASFVPEKFKAVKSGLGILGATGCGISAIYFAKPFAVKGLSPTVTKKELQ